MYGIGHKIKANKIPLEISHGLPTIYNQKLLGIALANDALFSLCIASIKLGSCGVGRYGIIVGKKVVDTIGTVVLLKLQNQ